MKGFLRARVLSILLIILLMTGCNGSGGKSTSHSKITISEQFGLAYAPLQVMKELKLMEKKLPGVEVVWKQMGNTAAIREAMLAKEVDIGFMAIPPFLIGWDKGMKWKIAIGLSSSEVGLVVNKDSIRSLRDFSDEDRIAVPQPGSVQHILLSMACEREFGDPHKLDNLLVTLPHPDGMNALLAKKEVAAHFTTPPYLSKELEIKGMHRVLSGKDAMGKDFTFVVGVAADTFHDKNPEAYEVFINSVREAISFINNNQQKAAALLCREYGMSEEETLKYLSSNSTAYSGNITGINEFAQFMKRNGYISKEPGDDSDVIWKGTKGEK